MAKCQIESCSKKIYARGLCKKHLDMIRSAGKEKEYIEQGYLLPRHNSSGRPFHKINVIDSNQQKCFEYIAWLNRRIEWSEKHKLPADYNNGLRDARKIATRGDRLLELIR